MRLLRSNMRLNIEHQFLFLLFFRSRIKLSSPSVFSFKQLFRVKSRLVSACVRVQISAFEERFAPKHWNRLFVRTNAARPPPGVSSWRPARVQRGGFQGETAIRSSPTATPGSNVNHRPRCWGRTEPCVPPPSPIPPSLSPLVRGYF